MPAADRPALTLVIPIPAGQGDTLHPKQVAEVFDVSWSTIYREIRRGRLRARRIGHGRGVLRVDLAEVRRYWDAAEAAAATELEPAVAL